MSGASIAAEAAAGLAEAGAATGTGPLIATLRKRTDGPAMPGTGDPDTRTLAQITCVQSKRRVRDGLAMTERTMRMLLIDPTGPVPAKGDHVAVGIAPAAVTDDTVWARIGEVETVAPGGVPLLFKAMLDE